MFVLCICIVYFYCVFVLRVFLSCICIVYLYFISCMHKYLRPTCVNTRQLFSSILSQRLEKSSPHGSLETTTISAKAQISRFLSSMYMWLVHDICICTASTCGLYMTVIDQQLSASYVCTHNHTNQISTHHDACIHSFMYTYIHTYIHIYIHTYIHTYKSRDTI